MKFGLVNTFATEGTALAVAAAQGDTRQIASVIADIVISGTGAGAGAGFGALLSPEFEGAGALPGAFLGEPAATIGVKALDFVGAGIHDSIQNNVLNLLNSLGGQANGLPDPFAGFTAPGTAPVSGNFPNFNSLPGGGTLNSASPFSTNLGAYSAPLTGVAPAEGTGYSAPDSFGGAAFNTLPGGGTLDSSNPLPDPFSGVTAPDNLGFGAPSPLPGSTIMPNEPLDLGGSGSTGMSSPSLSDPNYGFAPSMGVTPPSSLGTGAPSLLPGSDIMPNLPVNFDPNSIVPSAFYTADASANGFNLNPVGYISPAAFGVSVPANNGAPSGYTGGAAPSGVQYAGGYGTGGFGTGGFGGFGTGPVVLDLNGKGIKITQLSSSNMFFDMTGDGYKNQTAWAGAGNGVLFYDPTGKGVLTQANQFVFTMWDPSATSDMQALEDVFDTNHDGSLDSGDADFSDFFVMETNAIGTQTAVSLASLGIASINLTANNVNEALPDGSSIDGETTFTYANGTTGTAATVTFAYDPQGNLVTTTTTTNADGSTTVQNVADSPDGSLAYENILNTSANGLVKTLADENSGGVVTALQTDVTSTSNGVTTEVITNYANGAIQANGELTTSGVTGDKKLNSTTTITNGSTVTIDRDQLGGGWTTQSEVQTFSGDALINDVVSDLNPNGSASLVTTTATTNNGLTTTTTALVDNIAADSTQTVDSTVIGAPSGSILAQRTETVTVSKGTTTVGKTVTQTMTMANSVTATTSDYLTDGTTLDGTSVQTTVTSSSGSTTTQTNYAPNQPVTGSAFLDETVTNVDPTGLLKTISTDANGGGTAAAPVYTSVETDDTTVDSSGNRTETVIDYGGDGKTIQNEAITWRAASGPGRIVATYATGDGQASQTEVVAVNSGGATVDTVVDYAANGAGAGQSVTLTSGTKSMAVTAGGIVAGQTVTLTSANGLETVTASDAAGVETAANLTTAATDLMNGQALPANLKASDTFSVDTKTLNAGGSMTEASIDYASNGTITGQTVIATSANGLETASATDVFGAETTANLKAAATDLLNGQALPSNLLSSDIFTLKATVVNSDGSVTETAASYGSAGAVIGQTASTTSADKLVTVSLVGVTGATLSNLATASKNICQTFDTNETSNSQQNPWANLSAGTAKNAQVRQILENGAGLNTVVNFGSSGNVLNTAVTATSADGLITASATDVAGVETSLNLQDAAVDLLNGEAATNLLNPATGATLTLQASDLLTLDNKAINADGSTTETSTNYAADGAVINQTIKVTSANGLKTATATDAFGTETTASLKAAAADLLIGAALPSGLTVSDLFTFDVKTLNADGSTTETTTNYASDGAIIDQTVTKTGLTAGNGPLVTTTHNYDGAGVEQSTTDQTTINANGSKTEVVTDYTGTTTNGTVRDVTTTYSGIILAGLGDETAITTQSNGSVANYRVESFSPDASGTEWDVTQYYSSQGGPLLRETANGTSANGLVKSFFTAVNGDTNWDFWTQDSTILNADGSTTEAVATSNKSGLIDETVTTTLANGLSKTTAVDANGAVNTSGAAVFNLVTTDVTSFNNGLKTETVTNYNANSSEIDQTITTTSADGLTITKKSYLDETGSLTNVDQIDTTQTQANGSVVETVTSSNAIKQSLGTITTTTSGNGLTKTKTYTNGGGTTVDSQSDTTSYDANRDGGRLEDFEDADVINGVTFKSSVTTQTAGNDQTATIAMTLAGALSSTNVSGFTAVATKNVAIADSGITTASTIDEVNGATTAADTTTVITSADQLSTTTSTTLGSAASAFYVEQNTIHLDGSTTDTTTFYDPGSLSLVLEQTTVNTSWDSRTVTTTKQSDYDLLNNNGTIYSGPNYNVETDVYTKNANGTETETRTGTGSFGAPAYQQVINVVTNADASKTTTIQSYDGNGLLTSQTVEETSADDLVKSYVFDPSGRETTANLVAAAAALVAGTALPSSLAGTDIIGLDSTTLNTIGTKTETVETGYGASMANLRSETVTTTSANGLSIVSQIDNNGNGIFNQVDTTTIAPDGSKQQVFDYYGDTAATETTLVGTNTYTTSANGLTTTLVSSTGVTDTTVNFADSNGSYEWSQTVTPGSVAANVDGLVNGSASHMIDANGMDTWSWNNGYSTISPGAGDVGSITIDLATEKQDIAIANELFVTVFGQPMDEDETQYIAQFIVNGVFNRQQLAEDLIGTSNYDNNFGIALGTSQLFAGFDVIAAFENALGRMPTAEELGVFDVYMDTATGANSATDLATMTVALAQYATNLGTGNNRTQNDQNQDLVTTAPVWISPAQQLQYVSANNTYSYSNEFIADEGSTGAVVNGNGDIVVALNGSSITLSGYNDAIDNLSGTQSVTASNATVMIENGGIETVVGSNDQISQNGSTEVTLASGSGDTIYVAAGAPKSGAAYTASYSLTNASGSTITIASSVTDQINGSNDTVTLGASANATLTGASNSVTCGGSGDVINLNNSSGTWDYVTGSADTIYLNSSYGAVGGGGDTIVLSGTGSVAWLYNTSANWDSVVSSNSAVYFNSAQGSIGGGGNNVYLSGSGDAIYLYNTSGSWDNVSGSNSTISVASSQANVNGSSDNISLSGTGDAVSLANTAGTWDYVTGSGSTVNVNSSYGAVGGGGDTIGVSGAGSVVYLYNTSGNWDTVNGSSSTIYVSGSQATVNGSSDSINLSGGSALSLIGGSDTLIFQAALGQNTISGFSSTDTIQLSSSDFASWNVLQSSHDMTQVGANTVIQLDANDTITLAGVSMTSLASTQFKFV